MLAGTDTLSPLREFVDRFGALVARTVDERSILAEGGALLGRLIAAGDWLPASHAAPDPARYRQYLLHLDDRRRFSVVSFVWGPGQATPIHDHRIWGLVGVLRGAELSERFERGPDGSLRPLGSERLAAGSVEAMSPGGGDIHRVANAHADRTTISIHVYGGDIGTVERASYDADGREHRFVSGYAEIAPPDLRAAA